MLKKNKGITIIALVITIIVLLILVAVSISIAINGGLFSYARQGNEKTKNAINEEQILANGTIKVGDTSYDSIDDVVNEEEPRLPIEYQEVEYIQSTGTQYINTNFIPNQDSRIVADFQYTKNDHGYRFTGSDSTSNKFRFGTTGVTAWLVGYGSQGNLTLGQQDSNRHILDFNKNVVSLDDTVLYTFNYEVFNSYGNAYIFSINSNNINDLAKAKLYSYKLYDNGTLIRDFVPCYRRADLKPGLYDTVEGKFYTNQGTGEFIYPIEFDKIYQRVEYIESTGTQYIDTKFIPNQDSRIVADFQYTRNDHGYRFTGSDSTSNKFRFGTTGVTAWLVGYGSQGNLALGQQDSNRHILDFNKNVVSLDDTVIYTFNYEVFNSYGNAYIFSINSNNINDLAKTKLYSYKLYDNGILIRDFVPCYRESDGVRVVGLYDLCGSICPLTGTPFYTNSGTGEFIYPN